MGFEIICKDKRKGSKARAGILKTKSGDVETPFFMPVATKSGVKHIGIDDLESMNASAVISNAFVLFLSPGPEILKKAGGIGNFMKWKGINFTDSGGFQMYTKSIYLGSQEEGVWFKNPKNGDKFFVSPEYDMKIQLDIGSDVAMCLDSMPLYGEKKESIKEACRKTAYWARKCKLEHDNLQKGLDEKKRQLLFGICQGGIHQDLREESAKEISEIDFDGYALGGLALGEPKKDEYKMIEAVKKYFPEEKPVYLMGAGNPLELLESISRGVDMFDSRFPTKNARRGTLFTSKGILRVTNSKFKEDFSPIDSECDCWVCKQHSKAYVRHLLMEKEGWGYRMASYHNLYFLQNLMRDARKAIIDGTFDKLLEKFRKYYEGYGD